jgi:sigma-B regulation protein RsbU (phosphoserine phosphatase)
MWFAHKDTVTALRTLERQGLNNVIYLLERELTAAHSDALKAKITAVENIKTMLRQTGEAACAILGETADMEESQRRELLSLWADTPAVPDLHIRFFQIDEDAEGLHPSWPRGATGGAAPRHEYKALPEPAQKAIPSLLAGSAGEFIPDGEALAWITKHDNMVVLCSYSLKDAVDAAKANLAVVAERFKELLRQVDIQETGFAAVLDASGRIVAGPEHAVIPDKLCETLLAGTFSGAARRVMVLREEGESDQAKSASPSETLYLLGYFRPLQWHIVLSAPLDELEAPAYALVDGQLRITFAVLAAGLLLGFIIAARIAKPIRRLANLARELPEQDILSLDTAALTRKLPLRRKDEIGELAQAFGHMAKELQTNVTRLVESTAVRQRMEKELQVARDIQYGILPTVFPVGTAVDLYAAMRTAREVGGDLYDFFFLDERRLCFAIGDVSDKSIPAALFMSMTVTLLRVAMRDEGLSPEAAMARVNDALAADNPRIMFVTLCIGVLDMVSGEVVYSSAGHMPPVLIGESGACSLPRSGDMVAGVFEGDSFVSIRHVMQPGETLFLYTDGVSEAMNAAREQYGEKRLLAHLTDCYGIPSTETVGSVFRTVDEHAGDEEQSDDIAILTIRYLGKR